MAGQCVLVGFSKGGSEPTTTYAEWAIKHLCCYGTPGAKGSDTDSEWTKKNFTTINEGSIPDPASQTLSDLQIWAKENFITVD